MMKEQRRKAPGPAAGYEPLSPVSFIRWSAEVYPDHPSVIYNDRVYTWRATYLRCARLASALRREGVRAGDTVSILAANTPELYEAHFAVPMAGGVLNALNTRFDPDTIRYCLENSQTKALLVDSEYADAVADSVHRPGAPSLVVDIVDHSAPHPRRPLGLDYEELIEMGDDTSLGDTRPQDELDPITINYASRASGSPRPKGIVHHHRGAYLGAIGNILCWQLPHHPIYLWTLPMHHSNGWGFPWTVAAVAGTNVCLRGYNGRVIWNAVQQHGITHLCGAPIVLDMVCSVPQAERPRIKGKLHFMTGGSAPHARTLEKAAGVGVEVLHAYGLAEIQGVAAFCMSQQSWLSLGLEERAVHALRQGKRSPVVAELLVVDNEGNAVPANGAYEGEILVRGNTVMEGYRDDNVATKDALSDNYLHTGDGAVVHEDGYLEVRRRIKHIIKSGGETISCLEVEHVIQQHESVARAVVVPRPDPVWGESPCAFVVLNDNSPAIEADEIIRHCRRLLPHYKCPSRVVIGDIVYPALTQSQKINRAVLIKMASELV